MEVINMDKKLTTPLPVVLSGYILGLGSYFIWCFYFFYGKQYKVDYFLVIVAFVFAISAVYLFPVLLISYIKSFQKVWTSFSLVSIITLLIFLLIPYTNNLIYHKLNLDRDESIKTIEKNGPERDIPATNNIKISKPFEDAKEKIQTKQKRMKYTEFKLNNSLLINDIANPSIVDLQTKLESELRENDKLRKKLNETIRKLRSKDEIILALRSKPKGERKAEEGIIVKGNTNRDSSETKIKPEIDDADLDSIAHEIIFIVQIISSDTRLTINSPKLMGLKNVWEYEDGGLYKYTVGNEKDFKSASALQSVLRKKGFAGAFVVAFRNGKRMPIREALNLLN
jgi:hypothetical protein